MCHATAADTKGRTGSVTAVAGVMRVLSDATRLRLLGELRQGEANVSTLCDRLQLPQPTVSHHLGLLREARLVANRRSGKQVFYRLHEDTVSRLGANGAITINLGLMELRLNGLSDAGRA